MLAYSLLVSSLVASALALPNIGKRQSFTVQVGAENKLVFSPSFINAQVGDEVEFVFQSKNHSVVQSSFAQPCGPLDGGFNSEFHPVAAGAAATDLPSVKYTVTDTSKPLWFYCSQANHTPNSHCHAGMVFAINCPKSGDNSLANFIKKATSSAFATDPLPASPSSTDVITPLAPEPTYPGITIPPPESAATKTDVITLGTSTWTTVYASYPNSPDPTPNSVDGNDIKVIVGGDNQLTFSPMYVQAKPRDRIVFEFQSKNHSVVQSSFAAPCSPFVSALGASGINSGFQPAPAGSPFPTFTVTVNDTTPLWFYCSQPNHCGKGMVFAVNSDEKGDRSSSAFQSLAKQINGTNDNSGSGYGGSGGAMPRSTSALALAGAIAAAIAFAL